MKAAMARRDAARWICTAAVAFTLGVGLAYAKLPPLTDEQKAKAEEAKAKAAEATKKAREQEERAMDRVAERHKKEKGMKITATEDPKKK